MPAPRRVLPGDIGLFTRSTTQRLFLLHPTEVVTQIYLYCLAEAAERFAITLYAFVAMSNHQHIVYRDNHGNFPKFIEHLDKMLAKVLNRHWDRRQNLWSTEEPNCCLLPLDPDRLERVLYVLANPVKADLVEHCADWPGASSLGLTLSGKTIEIKRPKGYFRTEGVMPEVVELRIERLPAYEDWSQEDYAKMITERLREIEDRHKARRAREGKRVLGRKGVFRQSHLDSPTTPWPLRSRRPVLACHDPELREVYVLEIVAFRIAHRAALERLRKRERGVVFPYGTYRVKLFGVLCSDANGVPVHYQEPPRGARVRSDHAN